MENILNSNMNNFIESATYLHIFNCILSLSKEKRKDIKILDAGCGSGGLLRYLLSEGFDVYGYDITGAGYDVNFYESIKLKIGESQALRVKLIDYRDNIPFPDESFDFVISNQVVEHVNDFNHFYTENKRVLKRHGSMIHCFPIKNIIVEPHLFLPLIHRIPLFIVPYYFWLFKKSDWQYALNRKNYIANKVFYRNISFFKHQDGFEAIDFSQSAKLLSSKYKYLNSRCLTAIFKPHIFSFFSSITLIYQRKK